MMLKRLIFTVFVLCLFSAGFAQITKSGDFAIGGNGTENLPYLLQNDDGTFYALTASTSVDGFLDKTAPLYDGPNDFHFWLKWNITIQLLRSWKTFVLTLTANRDWRLFLFDSSGVKYPK